MNILHSFYQPNLTFNIAGTNPDYPTYVAIKGIVFDVSGNKAYGPEGSYKGESSAVQCKAQSKRFPSSNE
jgi:predicted heme/steroid binding protein